MPHDSNDRYYNTNTLLRNKNAMPNFVANIIRSHGPYDIFVTLSFRITLSQDQVIEYGKKITFDVIKGITGKHAKNRKKWPPVEGIAVIEMAHLFSGARKGGHIHYLIKIHPALPNDLSEALNKIDALFRRAANRQNIAILTRKGRKVVESARLVSDKVGVHVEPVDKQWGMARYLSKQANDQDWDFDSRVFCLNSPEGLGPLPSQKDKAQADVSSSSARSASS